MAINLLDMFKDVVGDQLARQASGFLGESTSNMNSAISAILPAILAGLVNKGESQGGAASILDFLKNEKVDGSILDNLGGMFGGGDATNDVLLKGSGVLDFIFGKDSSTLGKILDVVTNSSSIGRGSSSSLLKMVAPLVMGLIGRTAKNKEFDAEGLGSLLGSQKEFVKSAAPNGLLGKMGLAAFGDKGSGTSDEEEETASASSSASKSQIGPWIVLIGIALTMLYLMRSCGGREAAVEVLDKTEEVMDSAGEKVKDAAATAGDMIKDVEKPVEDLTENVPDVADKAMRNVVDGIASIKLPGGNVIEVESGSFIDKIYSYLNGGAGDEKTRFTFDNLIFQSNSANLAESSTEQLQSIATILTAYPEAQIRIEGHTDNTGEAVANKLLSEQRALAVKHALNGFGVENTRMVTAGFGEENPVAANDNEAGRRDNRRVDLYITKK